MPELRKDYLLEKYVIIATERAKRPMDFQNKKNETSPKDKCPFCPGNESMIPGVIDERKFGKDSWLVRAIWNKYKAVGASGNKEIYTHNDFYTFADAIGEHEVIIDSPTHGVEMEDLSENHVKEIIYMIIKRVRENYKKGAEYVTLFKNRGDDAGASLSHSHHQLISLNLFPVEIRKEIEAINNYRQRFGRCAYCEIIEREKDSYRRIYQDENIVMFTPYASRFPLEAWIMPKRCLHSITELNEAEINSLAKVLKQKVSMLNKLGYPAYNLFYKISNDKNKDYHFRIEVAPRIAKWAGFEYTTGVIINSMTPENAAKFYRGEE